MSQRVSGYARRADDEYITPPWVTKELAAYLSPTLDIWEPAAGDGTMAAVLQDEGHRVLTSDLPTNFLLHKGHSAIDAIVTNPPYGHAQQFIEHALELAPIVAMLLRTDYDHAATRRHLFKDNARFAMKLVLLKRIRWFAYSTGSPSFNHAWFVWKLTHQGPPVIAYGP